MRKGRRIKPSGRRKKMAVCGRKKVNNRWWKRKERGRPWTRRKVTGRRLSRRRKRRTIEPSEKIRGSGQSHLHQKKNWESS